MSTRRREFEALEVLRFLLALAVVAYHFFYYGPAMWLVPRALRGHDILAFGRFGVSAFFIISGFVIVYSARSRSAMEFGLARVVRLAPALVVCATATMVLLWALPAPGVEPPRVIAYLKSASIVGVLLGGGQVDPSYWSIVVEMRFYLGVGLMLWLAGSLRRLDVAAWVWLAASVAAHVSTLAPLKVITLSPHSAYFILGIALYLMKVERRSFAGWCLAVPALMLAGAQTYLDFERVDMLDGSRSAPVVSLVVAIAAFTLVWASLRVRSTIPGAQVLGAMSYPLYLLHQLVGYWAIVHLTPSIGPAGAAATAIGGVVLACWVFVKFAEPPMAAWIRNQAETLAVRRARPVHG